MNNGYFLEYAPAIIPRILARSPGRMGATDVSSQEKKIQVVAPAIIAAMAH